MSSRSRAAFAVAPFAVVLLLGGCSGGSSNSAPLTVTYKDAADATRTAGPAHTTGDATGPTGAANGQVTGAVDGDLTGSGVVTGTLPKATEIRWLDKAIYVKGVQTADSQKPWTKGAVDTVYAPYYYSPFAPAALADLLAMRRIPVDVTRDGSQRKMHATKALGFVGPWTNASVDLWVDGHNRITRVQISSKGGGLTYDVKYGGAAPGVTAPPESQIQNPSPQVPKPAGPFVPVRSGSTDGASWSLQRAPGTSGYECWRWQSTPPIKIVAADAAGIRCISPVDPNDDPAAQTVFVASSNGKQKYDVLAIRLPLNARSVTVSPLRERSDGTLSIGQSTTTPASGDAFVWVGPVAKKAGFAVVTLADGTRLACGPGSISLPSDWSSVTGTKKAQVMAEPWACSAP